MRQRIITVLIILFCIIGFLTGCTDDQKPTASFTIDPSFPQSGELVYLNSTSSDSSGEITSYRWEIDGELIGENSNITYVFEENGSFSVSLKVKNEQGAANTISQTVIVGGSSEMMEKLIGLWQWEGNNQLGNWTFYENNTLKSQFTGVLPNGEYGATSITYWDYAVDEDHLYFSNPSDDRLEEATYDYEFLEDDTLLRVSQDDMTADWYKIEG